MLIEKLLEENRDIHAALASYGAFTTLPARGDDIRVRAFIVGAYYRTRPVRRARATVHPIRKKPLVIVKTPKEVSTPRPVGRPRKVATR